MLFVNTEQPLKSASNPKSAKPVHKLVSTNGPRLSPPSEKKASLG